MAESLQQEQGQAKKDEDVGACLEAIAGRKEKLHKTLVDFHKKRNALAKWSPDWKDLDAHFLALETSLRARYREFSAKEAEAEARMKAEQAKVDERTAAVSAKEQASVVRVQSYKDVAVATILEQKRKWIEEKTKLEAAAETLKKAEAAAATAAEEDGKDRKAEKNDGKSEKNDGKSEKSSGKLEKVDSEKEDKSASKEEEGPKAVVPRPALRGLCERADATGLRRFIANHKKDLNALRAELTPALKFTSDPGLLVLKVLEGYNSPMPVPGEKRDTADTANRRACILLMEALAELLADATSSSTTTTTTTSVNLSASVKTSAKPLADQLKSKLVVVDENSPSFVLDAQSFLQSLVTFGLAYDYREDELCKLLLSIAKRKQTSSLCRALGLSHKVPDIVEKLIADGKQIEALSFAHSFGLFDRFQPVPLLQAFIKEARKAAQSIIQTGNNSAAAQNEATQKEISALKAVIKCIDEYKLESQYPSANFQKRIAQLEKAKQERKRSGGAHKGQPKRPRIDNNTASVAVGESGPRYGGTTASYGFAGQSSFNTTSPHGGYSSTLSASNRSPTKSSYPAYGSSSYTHAPSLYSGHQYGGTNVSPSSGPSYQSYRH